MKKTISMLALTLAASALTSFSQDTATPTPAAQPPKHEKEFRGRPPGPERGGPMREIMESLTPAEREQLKAARQKAKDDPAVLEARKQAEVAMKAARDAEKAAMLKVDATIGPILDKIEAAMKDRKPRGEQPPPPKE